MKISEGYMPFMGHHTYYRTVGERTDKAPLILMHGGPGSTHNYFEVLDRVAEEDGRMLVMYDQIGCGNSYVDGRPELWTAETWVNELITLREHLGLDTCHLLGQSWGGMLLLTYICNYEHSGVKSGILSSTLPASWLWGIEQARMIKELPEEYQEVFTIKKRLLELGALNAAMSGSGPTVFGIFRRREEAERAAAALKAAYAQSYVAEPVKKFVRVE